VRFPRLLLLLVLPLLLATPPADAQGNELPLGWQSPEEIIARIDAARKWIDLVPGADEAPGVVLQREVTFQVEVGRHKRMEDVLVQVNDPEALAALTQAIWFDARAAVEGGRVFVVREGEVRRLGDDELLLEKGDGRVLRSRLTFNIPDLQAGDVVGWSIRLAYERPPFHASIAAAARLPMVLATVRIVSQSGRHAFTIKGHATEGHQFVSTAEGSVNGRPNDYRASMKGIPAFPGLSTAAPFPPEVPQFHILLSESWEESPVQGWVDYRNWRRVALWISGLREAGLTDMTGLGEHARELVGDAKTDEEMEAAVYAYLASKPTLEGDAYEPWGSRPLTEIVAAQAATPLEKCLLMIGLLEKLGVEAELAGLRTEAWGPPDESFPSFTQFQHFVVRGGGPTPRFYVPFVEGLEPGSVPAIWGACITLAPAPRLTEKVREELMRLVEQGTPPQDLRAAMNRISDERGWVRIDRIGG
jgi:hypothetical protein